MLDLLIPAASRAQSLVCRPLCSGFRSDFRAYRGSVVNVVVVVVIVVVVVFVVVLVFVTHVVRKLYSVVLLAAQAPIVDRPPARQSSDVRLKANALAVRQISV